MMKKRTIRTRLMATVLAAVTACSVGSTVLMTAYAASVTAYATPAVLSSNAIPAEVSDGFFSGALTVISILSKSHPIAAVISSGLLGAFKTFYQDATKVPEPSNQDIVNLLNELSAKIDSHYNDQCSQIKSLSDIEKLQNFSRILTSVKGYNEKAMGQISLYDEEDVCAQDYQNIIDCTTDNNQFVNDFMDLSNLIIDGQTGIKGQPSFMQYLTFAKSSEENQKDASLVRADSHQFNQMTMEQYSLFFSNLITGMLAKYQLAEYRYSTGSIDLKTKNSLQGSIEKDMELYFNKAGAVAEKYTETENALKELTVATVIVNGKATEMYSFGDAWVTASQNNGTMKLIQDWKSDELDNDVFFYRSNNAFKNGALFVNGQNVTIDLNGHSIIHSHAQKYDLYSENGTITLINSGSESGSLNGIYVSGGKIDINGVTIRDSADAGIRADHTSMTIRNTTFIGNRNSAIVTEKNADTTIDHCTFLNNYESAVYNKESQVTIKNSTFDNNRSDSGNGTSKNGGAVYSRCRVTINDCTFSNNKANHGGAVYANDCSEVTNSIFTGNTAQGNGGAIMFDYRGSGYTESLTITGSRFTGNKAGNNGGAIYCDSMNYLTLKNVEITDNEAGSNGGGLYCQKGSTSSCDPEIGGRITIINNRLTNGTQSNAFLGENTTSKCIFTISDDLDAGSRIGVTSPTNDSCLDICKMWSETAYNHVANVFSYDTGKYRINRYTHWYSECYWVEIVKN